MPERVVACTQVAGIGSGSEIVRFVMFPPAGEQNTIGSQLDLSFFFIVFVVDEPNTNAYLRWFLYPSPH
jgi:hypothetical protein